MKSESESGNWRLSKKFRFEAAHRLGNNYPGKCSNIHGHSWNGSIEVRGNELDHFGFIVDLNELSVLAAEIERKYDHALLLQQSDENKELISLCRKNNFKVLLFQQSPTCETIARAIYQLSVEYLERKQLAVKVTQVMISETCTSDCTYSVY